MRWYSAMLIDYIPEGGWVALITGAFAFLSLIVQQLFAAKAEVRKSRREVEKASESVSQVETNTNDISARVDIGIGELLRHSEGVELRLTHIEQAVNRHLQWHMDMTRKDYRE